MAVFLFYTWVLVEMGTVVVLILQRVSLNALSDYVFPATATASLALVWSGYATTSSKVLRYAMRNTTVDPRVRERWSLISSYLERHGTDGAPAGLFGFAFVIMGVSALLAALGLELPSRSGFQSGSADVSWPTVYWGLSVLGLTIVLHAVVLHRMNGLARDVEARGFPLLGLLCSGTYGMRRVRGITLPKELTRFLAMMTESDPDGPTTFSLYETPKGFYLIHIVTGLGDGRFVPAEPEASGLTAREVMSQFPLLWGEARRIHSTLPIDLESGVRTAEAT